MVHSRSDDFAAFGKFAARHGNRGAGRAAFRIATVVFSIATKFHRDRIVRTLGEIRAPSSA